MKSQACWSIFFRLTTLAALVLLLSLALGSVSDPQAHAATTTPTLTFSDTTVHPYQKITVSVQGFAPNDTVTISVGVSGYEVTKLTCDSNGTASGEFTVPTTGPQGQYTFNAIGAQQGEATATATLTINPVILFDGGWDAAVNAVHKGGPQTITELNGYNFQPNETLNIYWGDASGTLLGTVTTDSDSDGFHFQFTIPSGLVPGKYKVTVVRTNQKPATLSTTFTLVPPSLSGPGGIHSGQILNLTGQGFQGREQVALSWNANGGQQLLTLRARFDGSLLTNGDFYAPSAPDGTYTITATGESSGLQATLSINIGPGLRSDTPVNPGGVLTINGGGFSAGEALTVYIVGNKTTQVSVTTAADGSFQTSLTVPLNLKLNTTYHVAASNSVGTEKAETFFNVETPSLDWSGPVSGYNNAVVYGSVGTIEGQDFPSNEEVTLYWNYQQAGQVTVGTAMTDAYGSFSFDLPTPSSPFIGQANIEAIPSTASYSASVQVQTGAAVYLNPTSVLVGQAVAVNGGSFAPNATITLSLQIDEEAVVGTATTDSTGAFTTSFTLPSTYNGGPGTVYATDGTTTVNTSLVVQVPLTLSPNTGSGGTSITVQTSNLNLSASDCDSNQPEIVWYDPTANNSQALSYPCPVGAFTTTVTAPANLVSGQSYQIELLLGKYLVGQTTFTAQ